MNHHESVSSTGRQVPVTVWRASLGIALLALVARTALVPSSFGSLPAPFAVRLFDAVLPLAVAAVMALAAWRTAAPSSRFARAWLLFALAYLAYGVAEMPFALFAVNLNTAPVSYISMALYLLFYPLFLFGVLYLPPAPLARRDRGGLALDMGVIMLGAYFLIWSFIVTPALAQGQPSLLRLVETIAFPLADLGVLWALLTLFFRGLVRSAAPVGRLMAGAAACMIASDAAYSYHLLFSSPKLWSVLSLGWVCSHLLAGLAAARQVSGIDHREAVATPEVTHEAPLASVYLAYFSIMVAVLVLLAWHLRWHSVVGSLSLLVMVVLGLVRVAMGLGDNERLKTALRAARDTLEQKVEERTADLNQANQLLTAEIEVRRRAERQTKVQLQRLAALRSVDAAITGSLDLHVTLGVFLGHVISQLEVDAATVLLLDPVSQTLEVFARKGCAGDGRGIERVAMGEGHAGRAALGRAMVAIPDLAASSDLGALAARHSAEGFTAYWAVPLVARGHVVGVLEVLHRTPLDPDDEWLDFLSTLAGQGAIAIDSMALFDRTQRANVELALAYDSTLEGWSRALELRHHETQGHTLRVTDLTVALARELGFSDEQLVHVRRGALLHDIGKMGIPDAVLLKPGPLSEQEWAIMRMHPVYAFEMLSRITYLHPALDIPFCHHEHWDGSGYPRGLKGTQIPLAARVFSVADNWDALSFDRPYRGAWPADRVRQHIREQTGALFDPQVAERFLAWQDAGSASS